MTTCAPRFIASVDEILLRESLSPFKIVIGRADDALERLNTQRATQRTRILKGERERERERERREREREREEREILGGMPLWKKSDKIRQPVAEQCLSTVSGWQ